MKNKFVHLHVHTEYSLLDGLSNIKRLFNHTKELGMDTIALTDHGAMYGAIDFFKAAKASQVKPIIGVEAYTTDIDHKKRPERGKFTNYHLLLLAKNEEGYKNLMKLTSIAHIEGYYYRPRFDRETLKKHSKGIVVTSACAQGEVAQALIRGDLKKAKEAVEWFADVFKDDYYLEIQRHNYDHYLAGLESPELRQEVSKMAEAEKTINEGVVKISRQFGIPIVATNDAHYIKQEDATAQDALVCIATGKNVSDIKRLRFIDTPTFYITSPDEMKELFTDFPEALDNTLKVADKCDLEISTLGKWFFPKFELPKNETDTAEYLRDLVYGRLEEKVDEVNKEIKERIEYELEIICNKGYAPYFLIVMDMVNWANEKGIITNTRGSAAGSLVSYVLGITTVNPITYYLPFERFLNPYRPSPPDIDFDVSDNRREEVIEYICQKYGYDKVAQICTFGRMLSRAAVRDVARVLGYPYVTGDRIAKLIPPPRQGFPITIPKALAENKELKALYDTDPDAKKILDLATQMEGSARHISVHAAGVVVSPTVITEFTPIQKEPSGEKIITQYEMHACEDVGLIKFDILGIRNLSILGSAIQIVKEREKIDIDLLKIPLDDKKTFQMLGRGDTMGTFQLSGSGMTRYLKELKPTRIEDLMAMVALYRPGPMAVIPEYIARKRNPRSVKYLDPRMEKFLESSYGLIVYQDDLLFCAIDLAGYSWEEADKFRKAVGKKIPEEMAAQKAKLMQGIIDNGQTADFAETLWQLFEPFQAYGFNKAHAASYGMVAYQTAYMKAHFPVEFMTALLTAESNDKEKVAAAIHECRRMGIKVLPPDINESEKGFTVVEEPKSLNKKGIRFGLDAIKNVGKAALETILEARKEGHFESFADFLSRIDSRKVNKKVLESLIKVGAMQKFGSRAALLASIDEVREKVGKKSTDKNQQGLFALEESFKNSAPVVEIRTDLPEISDNELQILEKELLGFSLSAKPITDLLIPFEHNATHKVNEILSEVQTNEIVTIAGVVTEVRAIITKRSGQEMAFVKVEDTTGVMELVVFPSIYQKTRSYWNEQKPLLITGKVDFKDESACILVESVLTEEDNNEPTHRLYLKIPKSIKADELKNLKNLLQTHPGKQKVTLVFEGMKERIDLPFTVAWNEDVSKEIARILNSR